jgi:hypothetical protein
MLRAVDRQITELVATRDRMQQTLRLWDRKLAGTAADQPAYLLETLGPIDRGRRDRRTTLKNRR